MEYFQPTLSHFVAFLEVSVCKTTLLYYLTQTVCPKITERRHRLLLSTVIAVESRILLVFIDVEDLIFISFFD